MDFITIVQILDSSVRLSAVLLFACLAGLFSERAGVFDIGLEGKMLMAAFFSAAIAAVTGTVWLGLIAGILASMMLALVHAIASITFRGNQLISGVAINFFASGTTVIIAQDWFSQGGRTPALSGDARWQPIQFPGAEAMKASYDTARTEGADPGGASAIYWDLLSGHTLLAYLAILAVPLTWYILYRTRFGLRLRAVGENPGAVDTAGVSVVRLRYVAVLICGLLCGLAGAYLATALSAQFIKEMTAGRGFIALAALIFAKWRPFHALGACLLFGFLEALSNRFSEIDLGIVVIPNAFVLALPYILTVVILAGFVGKAIPPRAGGEPYVKER